MEIINYVGFDMNRRAAPPAFRAFAAFWRRRRSGGRSVSFSFDHTACAPASAAGVLRSLPDVRAALIAAGAAADFLASHMRQALAAAGVLVCAAAGVLSVRNLVRYAVSFTGPLALAGTDTAEIDILNKTMAVFALDEAQEFASDGTLLDAAPVSGGAELFRQPVSFQSYKVRSGDTISGIARKFGLKNISTLIAVNDIDNVRQLREGQKLKIPSVDGLFYTVRAGDSLQSVASKYGVALKDILDVNDLDSDRLLAGQRLFVPGARLDAESLHQALGDMFRTPISASYRLTSRFGRRADPFTGALSYHTGIDMACPQGTPISAAMSGKVSFTGYSNVFGNYVIISHANGYQTLYGHMSKIYAAKGSYVSQGTRIGLVGSTGYSTGPHLHFTVYKNGKIVDPLPLLK